MAYRATHHAHLFWVCHCPGGSAFPGESELWSASETCFSVPPLFLGIPACLLSHLTSLALSYLSSLSHKRLTFLPAWYSSGSLQFAKNLHSHVISHWIPGPPCCQCAESRGLGTGISSEWQLPGPQAWAYPTAHPPPDLLVLWSQVKGPLWPQEHYGRFASTP